MSASKEAFTLRGHAYEVQTLSFHYDKLASGGKDSTIIIWDSGWRQLVNFNLSRGHKPNHLCWDPNANNSARVASVSVTDKALRIWDLKSRREDVISTEFENESMIWSSDGNFITLKNVDNTLSIMDVRKAKVVVTSRKFNEKVYDFTYFLNSKLLVGTESGNIEFLNPLTLETSFVLRAHTAAVNSVKINPKKPYQFITGGADALVELWDASDMTCHSTIDRTTAGIHAISVSKNGQWIAHASEKIIDISHSDNGDRLALLNFEQREHRIRTLAFNQAEAQSDLLAYCFEDSPDIYVQPVSADLVDFKAKS